MKARVAALSYPMFTQTPGGLEIQIRETLTALQALGCDVRLIDPYRERLADFDLVHVFAAGSGNHRIVQFARLLDRPVVLSPLLRSNWTRSFGRRARWLDAVVGKLTNWSLTTEYRQLHGGLAGADLLVALGERERKAILDAFGIEGDKVAVVPNGIPRRFFEAAPRPFLERFGVDAGFVLNVASIDRHKNQLGLAHALDGTGRRLVLIGHCEPDNRSYLDELRALPHVAYVGGLPYDDPLLASAYAAAGAFCLASASEVMPLVALESLAAGTPVVMTRHHGMDTAGMEGVLIEIEPSRPREIRAALERLERDPAPAERCREAVAHLTWDAVGSRLLGLYERVLQSRKAARASETDRPAEATAAFAGR